MKVMIVYNEMQRILAQETGKEIQSDFMKELRVLSQRPSLVMDFHQNPLKKE